MTRSFGLGVRYRGIFSIGDISQSMIDGKVGLEIDDLVIEDGNCLRHLILDLVYLEDETTNYFYQILLLISKNKFLNQKSDQCGN